MLEFNFILRASPHTLSFTDSIEMFELSEGGGAEDQGGRCILNNIQQGVFSLIFSFVKFV